MKTCSNCKETKPEDAYYLVRKGTKVDCWCKACRQAASLRVYKENKSSISEAQSRKRSQLRAEMLEAYGGKCSCCGESEPAFMTLDHINGGGKQHQREAGGTREILKQLKREGWPKDEYRILCYNCNCGRNRNGGVCPHVTPMPLPSEEAEAPEQTHKTCIRCLMSKPLTEFFRHGGYPGSYCKPCASIYRREYRARPKLPKMMDEPGLGVFKRCSRCELWKVAMVGFHKSQNWCKLCAKDLSLKSKDRTRKGNRDRYHKTVAEVITRLGGRCACCGERNRGFLVIDHINGGGTAERRKSKGVWLYDRVRKEGCPPDKYRVLCYNCNGAYGVNKCCPHEV